MMKVRVTTLAMGVQGERVAADGVQKGGGGSGFQVDHSEHILIADTGDLWNVSCSMEPGVSQVQSPSSVLDFGFDKSTLSWR